MYLAMWHYPYMLQIKNLQSYFTDFFLCLQFINHWLKSYSVPVELVSSIIDRITVTIPWSTLLGSSTLFEVHGLNLILKPKCRYENGKYRSKSCMIRICLCKGDWTILYLNSNMLCSWNVWCTFLLKNINLILKPELKFLVKDNAKLLFDTKVRKKRKECY